MKKILTAVLLMSLVLGLCACTSKGDDQSNTEVSRNEPVSSDTSTASDEQENPTSEKSDDKEIYYFNNYQMEIPTGFIPNRMGNIKLMVDTDYKVEHNNDYRIVFFALNTLKSTDDESEQSEKTIQKGIYSAVNAFHKSYEDNFDVKVDNTKDVIILNHNFERRTGIIHAENSDEKADVYYVGYYGTLDVPEWNVENGGFVLFGYTDGLDDAAKKELESIIDHAAQTIKLYY